eukprot:332368_1
MQEHKETLLAHDNNKSLQTNVQVINFADKISTHPSNKSGILAPSDIQFGDGRRWNLKYYQYSSTSSQIIDKIKNDLDEGRIDVDFDEDVDDVDSYKPSFSFRRLWAYTGPGWLMSIAYLDPGNLESDLQAGAVAGYQLIWVLWWSTVLGWLIQTLSARLGVVTGRHLAQICRYEYNKPVALALWIMTELAIIGSDIQEVVGSAVAFRVLFGWPLWIGCLLTAVDAFTFLLLSKLGMRFLEAFFCSLIGVMAITFGIEFFIGKPNLLHIAQGWGLPLCEADNIEQAVGIVGAVIMPHNLFLHSALVQTRNLRRGNRAAVAEGNYYFTIEGGMSLFVSFFINLFIVAVFAKGFHTHNTTGIDQHDIGLENAGDVLGQRFGDFAKYIWGVGLLAAGQASTMTGTFAGQYCMSGFLEIHWEPWKRTMLTRCLALGPSLVVAIAAAKEMDTLNEWLNVQQSVQLPFALLPLLFFNCNPRIMGHFVLARKWEVFFWLASFAIIAINVYLTLTFMSAIAITTELKYLIIAVALLLYLGFCGYIMADFCKQRRNKFSKVYSMEENVECSLQKGSISDDIALIHAGTKCSQID